MPPFSQTRGHRKKKGPRWWEIQRGPKSEELGARSVAFPAISTGVYRWPIDDAAIIALRTVSQAPSSVAEIRFVLFDDRALTAFRQAADSLGLPLG